MSHKKTWHHERLLCVLTHDLKGWHDSQDKRGGDVTCSGYDEDDEDDDDDEDGDEDWSQDYDKRGGDVTCGQGGGNYQGWDCSWIPAILLQSSALYFEAMNYYHYHWNPAIILQSSLSSACITV